MRKSRLATPVASRLWLLVICGLAAAILGLAYLTWNQPNPMAPWRKHLQGQNTLYQEDTALENKIVHVPDEVVEEVIDWLRPVPDNWLGYGLPTAPDGRKLLDLVGQEITLEGEGVIWAGIDRPALNIGESFNPPKLSYLVNVVGRKPIPKEFSSRQVRVTGKLDLRWVYIPIYNEGKGGQIQGREKEYFLDDARWEFIVPE